MSRKAEKYPKAERERLRDRMLGYGCTVGQIAAEMSRRFNLRPRLAWRYALDWSQWKLAQEYNRLHSGSHLTDTRVSAFEGAPHNGSRPSLRYLVRLATTYGYGCTPSQLVDADDLEHFAPADRVLLTTGQPPAQPPSQQLVRQPTAAGSLVPVHAPSLVLPGPGSVLAIGVAQPGGGQLMVPRMPQLPPDPAMWATALGLGRPDDLSYLLIACLLTMAEADGHDFFTAHGHDTAYDRIVHLLDRWAYTMKRRLVLRGLGWVATAASVGHVLDGDEQARVAGVLGDGARLDAATLGHIEQMLWHTQRVDDRLGPRGALDLVLVQRDMIRSLLPDCPDELRSRLLAARSVSSRMAGWFSFDLNDHPNAEYYYEDSRTAAHDAENTELGAYALASMSLLVTRQGKPRLAIDHAMAAQQWASQIEDLRIRALCEDQAARTYAAAGQRDACLAALDSAHRAIADIGDQPSGYMWHYSEEVHFSKRGECHLALYDAQGAADYAQRFLANPDLSRPRIVALTKVELARALAQLREVEESARLLGEAAAIASWNTSLRLVTVIKQAYADLRPWADTAAVRALDDQLTAYGLI